MSVRLKKLREGENTRPDVTQGRIEYFMMKLNAKALHYQQPGEIVGLKVNAKYIQINLIKGKRLSYKESSILWKMNKKRRRGPHKVDDFSG